jgi:two-component system, NtrC family, sensor kinase
MVVSLGGDMRRRGAARGAAKRPRRTGTNKGRKASIARESKANLHAQLDLRTRERDESLQQQTATADVLKVISRSSADLETVLDTLVETVARLCRADQVYMFHLRHGLWNLVAGCGLSAQTREFFQMRPFTPGRGATSGRAALERRAVHIPDVLQDPEYTLTEGQEIAGYRTTLGIPLLREDALIGVYSIARTRVEPFTSKEIELASTFADQAVIAIENARLINETREALERQTATADILKVIAGSPDDVQPVFQIIAERSNELVGGLSTSVLRFEDGMLHMMAYTRVSPEADAALKIFYPKPLSAMPWGESARLGKVYITTDIESEDVTAEALQLARLRGWRSVLIVPLLSDKTPIGAISVTRRETGGFAENHVQLLKTFADQAVIAISNVGLFNEVQQRTRELSRSLDDLRAAQDRLVQTEKLASLGQLTAGIAHEIKNPLNFVNNFSVLSAELTGELNDLLKDATLTDKTRTEVEELTRLLQDNLEKVVQHGKRADSIVKNMLLHSREGSREQRPADVNTLVDESLNLAYHGARAEKSGFEITLQRDFDANAGIVELFPQEISRALLNLLSNGFYAATRRKAQNGGAGAEPTVLATTKNLGSSVEIRIRDNGAGIPPEIREKMFNPFFTTKPTGEGTGLGLSITHDIIVKQHGGRIDVETRLGEFTEFIITLPRNNRTAPG